MGDSKHLWEYDHPYYCTEGNYFLPGNRWQEAHNIWESWAQFHEAWGDVDPNYNLLFRWDWYRPDPDDYLDELREDPDYVIPHRLELFFYLQRKGYGFSHYVNVTEADEPAVRAWLAERGKHMVRVWEPLLGEPEPEEA